MPIATGIAKKLAFKVEATWNTLAGAAGAKYLRRVTSDIGLTKDTYQSEELRSDYQVADFRHGTRKVEGSIDGELAPGSFDAFFAAALRADFAAVGNLTALTLTVAAASGTPATQVITRSTGDWMAAGGVKVGNVIRCTVGLNAASLNRNLLVVDITSATAIKVFVLDGGAALTTEAAVPTCTVTIPGKKTFVPLTGHTNRSYTLEQWFSDVAQSEVYSGMRVAKMEANLPATGIAKLKTSFMGGGMTTAQAQYFTTPTAAAATGVLASVNGLLVAGGIIIGYVTGLTFSIDANASTESVVGSNYTPDVFVGSVVVQGEATVFFQDAVFRDYFVNETEVMMVGVLTTGNTGTSDFVSFAWPRVKFGGAQKTDGQKGIQQSMPFQALLPATGGTGVAWEQTTMMMQDSLAA